MKQNDLARPKSENYKSGLYNYNEMKQLIEIRNADCNNNDNIAMKSLNPINNLFDLPNFTNGPENQFSTPIVSNRNENQPQQLATENWHLKSPTRFGNKSSSSSIISNGSESGASSLLNYGVNKNAPRNFSNSRKPNRFKTFRLNENLNYQEARYKTELCLHFRESNTCPHNTNCLFAHGLSELRPYRGRHPKHKTQKCKAFHEEGYCNYGYRCSYIHSESPNTINQLKKINNLGQENKRKRLNLNDKFNETLNSTDSQNSSFNECNYFNDIEDNEFDNFGNYRI